MTEMFIYIVTPPPPPLRVNSGAQIKIAGNEGDGGDRLVTITGTPEAVGMAQYLINSRWATSAEGVLRVKKYTNPRMVEFIEVSSFQKSGLCACVCVCASGDFNSFLSQNTYRGQQFHYHGNH